MKIGNAKDIHGNPLLSKVVASGMLSGEGTPESPLEFSGISVDDAAGSSVVSSMRKIVAGEGIIVSAGESDAVVIEADVHRSEIQAAIETAVVSGIGQVVSGQEFVALQTMASDNSTVINGHLEDSSIHVPEGGTSGQFLRRGDNGEMEWSTVEVAGLEGGVLNPSVIPDLSDKYAAVDSMTGTVSSDVIPNLSDKYAAVDSATGKIAQSAIPELAGYASVDSTTHTISSQVIPDLSQTYVATSAANQPNGYVRLTSDGKLPSSLIPTTVDDIIAGYYDWDDTREFYEEYAVTSSVVDDETVYQASFTSQINPRENAIYVDKLTEKTYRWASDADYVEISPSLVTGITPGTAYPGEYGAALASAVDSASGRIYALEETVTALDSTMQSVESAIRNIESSSEASSDEEEYLRELCDSNIVTRISSFNTISTLLNSGFAGKKVFIADEDVEDESSEYGTDLKKGHIYLLSSESDEEKEDDDWDSTTRGYEFVLDGNGIVWYDLNTFKWVESYSVDGVPGYTWDQVKSLSRETHTIKRMKDRLVATAIQVVAYSQQYEKFAGLYRLAEDGQHYECFDNGLVIARVETTTVEDGEPFIAPAAMPGEPGWNIYPAGLYDSNAHMITYELAEPDETWMPHYDSETDTVIPAPYSGSDVFALHDELTDKNSLNGQKEFILPAHQTIWLTATYHNGRLVEGGLGRDIARRKLPEPQEDWRFVQELYVGRVLVEDDGGMGPNQSFVDITVYPLYGDNFVKEICAGNGIEMSYDGDAENLLVSDDETNSKDGKASELTALTTYDDVNVFPGDNLAVFDNVICRLNGLICGENSKMLLPAGTHASARILVVPSGRAYINDLLCDENPEWILQDNVGKYLKNGWYSVTMGGTEGQYPIIERNGGYITADGGSSSDDTIQDPSKGLLSISCIDDMNSLGTDAFQYSIDDGENWHLPTDKLELEPGEYTVIGNAIEGYHYPTETIEITANEISTVLLVWRKYQYVVSDAEDQSLNGNYYNSGNFGLYVNGELTTSDGTWVYRNDNNAYLVGGVFGDDTEFKYAITANPSDGVPEYQRDAGLGIIGDYGSAEVRAYPLIPASSSSSQTPKTVKLYVHAYADENNEEKQSHQNMFGFQYKVDNDDTWHDYYEGVSLPAGKHTITVSDIEDYATPDPITMDMQPEGAHTTGSVSLYFTYRKFVYTVTGADLNPTLNGNYYQLNRWYEKGMYHWRFGKQQPNCYPSPHHLYTNGNGGYLFIWPEGVRFYNKDYAWCLATFTNMDNIIKYKSEDNDDLTNLEWKLVAQSLGMFTKSTAFQVTGTMYTSTPKYRVANGGNHVSNGDDPMLGKFFAGGYKADVYNYNGSDQKQAYKENTKNDTNFAVLSAYEPQLPDSSSESSSEQETDSSTSSETLSSSSTSSDSSSEQNVSYVVQGASPDSINGTYSLYSDTTGYGQTPIYSNGNGYYLWCIMDDFDDIYWVIDNQTQNFHISDSAPDRYDYYVQSATVTPPTSGWNNGVTVSENN